MLIIDCMASCFWFEYTILKNHGGREKLEINHQGGLQKFSLGPFLGEWGILKFYLKKELSL